MFSMSIMPSDDADPEDLPEDYPKNHREDHPDY